MLVHGDFIFLVFLIFCVALEDELLELISGTDRVLTPAKHVHTRPGILQSRSTAGGQSSSACFHMSPSSQQYHHTSSHRHTGNKREHKHEDSNGTPSPSQEFDDELQHDYHVKGNFTSAPLSAQKHSITNTSHQETISGLESELCAVGELLEILKGSVLASIPFLLSFSCSDANRN